MKGLDTPNDEEVLTLQFIMESQLEHSYVN